MEEKELTRSVLLSMQRALWGRIYPEVRAIAVGFESTKKLEVVCYLDREPNEEDYENIREVTSEVFADIDFIEVEEHCLFSAESISKLDHLNAWCYIRKE
jgi:hypothetical protein